MDSKLARILVHTVYLVTGFVLWTYPKAYRENPINVLINTGFGWFDIGFIIGTFVIIFSIRALYFKRF